jgi:hypothetical protein
LRKKYTQLNGTIATYRLFSGKISGKPRATPAFLTSRGPDSNNGRDEKHAAQRPEKIGMRSNTFANEFFAILPDV